MDRATFQEILEALDIRRGDVLFVHSSMDWIGGEVADAVAIIEQLIDRIGPWGNLCMPSYIWRGNLPGRPKAGEVFDVRRSPTVIGLLPEVFRRTPGVVRGAHYWVPVCASGHDAVALTAGQHQVVEPFGEGATLRRVMEAGGKVVGMGVSLNTSSLAHLPDQDLRDLCPVQVMSETPIEGVVIDEHGIRHVTQTRIVRSQAVSQYRPSALFEHHSGLRETLRRTEVDGANFFAYPASAYHEAGVEIGRAWLASGRLPPWLEA